MGVWFRAESARVKERYARYILSWLYAAGIVTQEGRAWRFEPPPPITLQQLRGIAEEPQPTLPDDSAPQHKFVEILENGSLRGTADAILKLSKGHALTDFERTLADLLLHDSPIPDQTFDGVLEILGQRSASGEEQQTAEAAALDQLLSDCIRLLKAKPEKELASAIKRALFSLRASEE